MMNDIKGIIDDCKKSDIVSRKFLRKIIEIIGQRRWHELYDEENDIRTTMGELIITLRGCDISKPEFKDQLKSFEGYINDIPMVIDPCRMCKNHDDNKGFDEICSDCCWFYDSKFEVKND